MLRFLGARDHDTRWDMGDAHGGIRRVDVLATGAGGAHGVDTQIIGIYVNIDVFGFG